MKKTIIIVILVVYVASIAVVNFFGLAIKEFDGIEYVQEIKCDTITVLNEVPVTVKPGKASQLDKNGNPILEFYFEFISGEYTADPKSIADNPNRVRLDYDVLPHSADGSKIGFVCKDTYDDAGNLIVQFDKETQTFVFLESFITIEVTLVSTDGSNKSKTIKIMGVE